MSTNTNTTKPSWPFGRPWQTQTRGGATRWRETLNSIHWATILSRGVLLATGLRIGLGEREGSRLRELAPYGQREKGGGIHAT